MVKVMLVGCDKCGSTDDVKNYKVGLGDETPYELDLCDRCAEPLSDLIELGRRVTAGWVAAPQAGSARQVPMTRTKVYSPEELDKMEEEYREQHKKDK